ncbi:MAG TPA: hypothetical protein VMT34_09130 [Aggregatilineales bacterium]|nr:hypothetical protein [Aggregatilineales bacterium]
MSEPTVLLQFVTYQRDLRPSGRRIWSDGRVQRAAEDNPLPGSGERLDLDREIAWADEQTLSAEQIAALRDAILAVRFFDLPVRMLINYCKEDPGTTIWTAMVDGRSGRVVVFDPRPRRSPELDTLLARLTEVLAP